MIEAAACDAVALVPEIPSVEVSEQEDTKDRFLSQSVLHDDTVAVPLNAFDVNEAFVLSLVSWLF